MNFEEIFEEEGLYVADSFKAGTAFQIKKNSFTGEKELKLVQYSTPDQLFSNTEDITVYAGLFKKEYKKAFTRQNLFK